MPLCCHILTVFLIGILEPHLQVKMFDAFEYVKTNIVEFNIFTATEHEPKVKV